MIDARCDPGERRDLARAAELPEGRRRGPRQGNRWHSAKHAPLWRYCVQLEPYVIERDARACKRFGMGRNVSERDARTCGDRAAFEIARAGPAYRADAIVEHLDGRAGHKANLCMRSDSAMRRAAASEAGDARRESLRCPHA
jgi:hypothetical protein